MVQAVPSVRQPQAKVVELTAHQWVSAYTRRLHTEDLWRDDLEQIGPDRLEDNVRRVDDTDDGAVFIGYY